MNKRELQKKLSALKTAVAPDQNWKATQRAFLMSRIQAQAAAQPIRKNKFEYAWAIGRRLAQPVGAMTLGLAVVFGSLAASVTASTSSLPGDTLYGLKLTSEKIHVSLVTDKKAKADLQLSYAKKRVEEIKEVVKREHDPVKVNKQIKKPLENLKVTVASLSRVVEETSGSNGEEALSLAKTIKEVTVSASKAVKNAEIASVEATEPTETVEVEEETKQSIAATVSSSSVAQLNVIKGIAEKDPVKGKEALLSYVTDFKIEKGLTPAETGENPEAAAEATTMAAEAVVTETEAATEEETAVEETAEAPAETAEPVELTEEEKTALAAKEAEEKAKAEAAAAKAAEEAAKIEALKEMIKMVEDLIAKDDLKGALEILITYNQPKTENPAPVEPAVEQTTDTEATEVKAQSEPNQQTDLEVSSQDPQ